MTKLLYEKGYSKEQVLDLYGFIDWVLTLPAALEKIFLEDLRSYEKEKDMPYVTNAERIGRKEGKLELYIDLIQNMNNNNLSEQEIARLINLDIEIVRKVLNNEKVEIPLHLLDH